MHEARNVNVNDEGPAVSGSSSSSSFTFRNCALLTLALLFLLGCGDDDAPVDAGTDASTDAPTDAPVDARPGDLDGPGLVFVSEEACYQTGLATEMARFIWGDGTRDDVEGNEACHAWTFPGTFLVSVQAGGLDASRVVRVVPRPADVAPVSSSPLIVREGRAWIASADADQVVVVELESMTATYLAACRHPRTLGESSGVIAAACEDGTLARWNATTMERLSDLELGAGTLPFGVVGSTDAFFVTLRGNGELVRVEGETMTRLDVGFDARAIALSDTRALITRWRSDREGARVVEVDVDSMRVVDTILLPREEGLDSDTNNSGVPSFLDAIAFTPDGERALVASLKANVVAGTFRSERELTSQTTARAILSELLPTSDDGDYVESFRFAFDDLDFASAVVATPLGDRIFVAIMGAQRVIALEPFNFDVVGSIANVGIAPRALALHGEDHLLVYADLSRELRVYDVSDLSAEPPLLATIPTVESEPLSPEVLRGKQIFHSSVDPRMSRTSYLSCATCHLDGEGDNLVWDFTQRGEGLRNTIDLGGRGGVSQGPVHWTGNFDEIQDFEADIRLHQGGAGFLDEDDWTATRDPLGAPKAGLSEELDALAAYVGSLSALGVSPHRRDDDAFETQRAMGESVFASAGCPTCHAGPSYTDSALDVRHDVGTLGPGSGQRLGGALDGLDTPTLRGLWRNAPYLHDGSATLREVLTTRNPDDLHGTTSDLSADELDALELFLLTLDDA